jgi:Ca2+-binding RTX toxin-like protein
LIIEIIARSVKYLLNELYSSNEKIYAGNGDNIIYLSDGDDDLRTENGNDTIHLLGSGNKRIISGLGEDIYVIYPTFKSTENTFIQVQYHLILLLTTLLL